MVKRTLKKVLKATAIFAIVYVALITALTYASAILIPVKEDEEYDDYYDEDIEKELF